jgi:hypothetical protein
VNNNPKYKEFKEIGTKLKWISSLREYENNVKFHNNINKSRCISSNYKKDLFDKKYNNSFDKRDIIYNSFGKANPLFAQIIPNINNKQREKIRDTLNNDSKRQKNICCDLSLENLYCNKIKMKKRINLYKGLNIKGKKLLNFEIELSKDLEGKKKRIIQYPYKEEELTTKLFAKSFSVNNFYIPKSLKNTIELHYNNE